MRWTIIFGYFVSAFTAFILWEGINSLEKELFYRKVKKLTFIYEIANEEFGECTSAHMIKLKKLYGYEIWKEGHKAVSFFESDIQKLLKMNDEERKQFVLEKCRGNGW